MVSMSGKTPYVSHLSTTWFVAVTSSTPACWHCTGILQADVDHTHATTIAPVAAAHVQMLSTSRWATLGMFDFMPVTAAGNSSPHQNTTPASIHEALHSLVQGASQPAPVPLLASRQAPCVQRMCDLLELYSLLRETNAASIQFLMQPGLASTTAGAVPATAGAVPATAEASRPPFSTEARSSGRAHANGTAAAAVTLQQGARKVVLAMVEKVSLASKLAVTIAQAPCCELVR